MSHHPTPVIAIAASTEIIRGLPRVRANAAYVNALLEAGALPLLLPPRSDVALHATLARRVDGVLLTGGEDIDPARYGAPRHANTEESDPARDAAELALVAAAREHGLPLLAICRGAQLLNVACGGTLVQDLPDARPAGLAHAPGVARDRRVHDVTVDAPSRLATAIGATRIAVNSLHHQAVARIGTGLRVVVRAPDDVVEGIEAEDPAWWAVGVQWHPEELTATPEPWDRALFAAFRDVMVERGASGL